MKLNITYSYVQTPAYKDDSIDSFKAIRGWNVEYDGLTEVWWESYGAMVKQMGSPEAQEANKILVEDEEKFVANTVICFLSYEREIFGTDNK
jgi:hypothetical protein